MRQALLKSRATCMNSRVEAIALASQSPRRKALLESLGLRVSVIPSSYLEQPSAQLEDPAEAALRHALGKARQAQSIGPPLLVAADTIVAIDQTQLGKPRDAAEATAMLGLLSGREHRVYTGFVVADRATGQMRSGVECTAVRFLPLEDAEIEAYVASGDPLDKAGAYGIQGRGGLLVRSVCGDFYTVMGLPLARVGVALRELGYTVLAP